MTTISKTRKQYTVEFKEEALRPADKVSVTKAARELGVYSLKSTTGDQLPKRRLPRVSENLGWQQKMPDSDVSSLIRLRSFKS